MLNASSETEGGTIDPVLVISPHADDAALSAGQFLAGWPGAYVLTLFCGRPAAPLVTTFDVNSGFRDSTAAQVARAHEDDRAMQVLGARQLRAAFLDNQYRSAGVEADLTEEIVALIARTVSVLGATKLLGPLGLAHPDHVIASDATAKAARMSGVPCWLYEDIPVRVLEPEWVGARVDALRGRVLGDAEFIGTGDLARKQAAVECYRSQLWALDRNVIYVPERFHRVVS